MLIKYIKSNWFAIALIVLGALAIAKNKLPFGLGSPAHAVPSLDKYTDKSRTYMGMTSSSTEDPSALDDQSVKRFLERFVNVALNEKKKFQIPAAVILGTALIQSQAGKNDAATKQFDYFGLSGKAGTSASAWESFRNFSLLLSNQPWFPAVQGSGRQDCKTWAQALQKHLYGANSGFEAQLCAVIEKYDLQELDK